MSVVRVGATKQYSDNWDNIFTGGKGSTAKKKAAGKPTASAKKKSAKKKTPKKAAKKVRRK